MNTLGVLKKAVFSTYIQEYSQIGEWQIVLSTKIHFQSFFKNLSNFVVVRFKQSNILLIICFICLENHAKLHSKYSNKKKPLHQVIHFSNF